MKQSIWEVEQIKDAFEQKLICRIAATVAPEVEAAEEPLSGFLRASRAVHPYYGTALP